jgi:hypothetical protein
MEKARIFSIAFLLGLAGMLLFSGNILADEKAENNLSEVTLYVSGMT